MYAFLQFASRLWLALAAACAHADTPALPSNTIADDVIEEVRVVGERLRFGVDGEFEPDVVYDQAALRALAVSSIAELLEELAPELDSGRARGRGRPLYLVNGQRIGSFREIWRFPREAVARVEVYPEPVALQYGARPDQKVINFVLRERFRATWLLASGGASAAGDGETTRGSVGHLRIRQGKRWSLSIERDAQQPIHESDRSVSDRVASRPSSRSGNVFATAGGEIDPTLSQLAGEPVTAATLPADFQDGAGALTLTDLLPTANSPRSVDEASTRTLVARQLTQTVGASYALPVSAAINASFSAEFSRSDLDSEQGLATLGYPVPAAHPLSPFDAAVDVRRSLQATLQREQTTEAFEAHATLNGRLGTGSWNWLNSYNYSDRDVWSDRTASADTFTEAVAALDASLSPFGPPAAFALVSERDVTRTHEWVSRLLLRGSLGQTRHGPILASAGVAFNRLDRSSRSALQNLVTDSDLRRDLGTLQLSLDAPLYESERWGRLSLNLNSEYEDYSDFGVLSALGGEFTWRPSRFLRLTLSHTREDGAPGMEQLGDALSRIPNRRVFDPLTGESVLTTVLTGGNATLRADTRRLSSVNVRIEPFDTHNLALTLDYTASETDDPILSFPAPNAELEALFPQRFTRNPSGTLIEFDSRPINLERERRRELRSGIRYSRPLRSNASQPGGASRGSGRGGRLRLALFHTYVLQDDLTLGPATQPIDYVGISNSGRARSGAQHEVMLRGSYSNRGWAARFNLSWQDRTSTLPGFAGVLRTDDLLTLNLKLVYSFRERSPLVQRYPFLRSARVRLRVENLFDEKPRVVDAFGVTPAGSSPDERDPLGRMVTLELRKLLR